MLSDSKEPLLIADAPSCCVEAAVAPDIPETPEGWPITLLSIYIEPLLDR